MGQFSIPRKHRPDRPPRVIEERRTRRRKVFLPGKLVYDNGIYSLDCTIRNISEAGAGLDVPKGLVVPPEVFLIDIRHGVAHEATVTIAGATKLGLRFLRSYRLADSVAPRLEHIRQLWVNCAS